MKKFFILIFLLIIFSIFFKYYKDIYDKLPYGLKIVILSILNNEKTQNKIENDNKTKFLPQTQLIDLSYEKSTIKDIELKEFEVAHGQYNKSRKVFFLENKLDDVFLMTKRGYLYKLNFSNLKKNNNYESIEVKTNLIENIDRVMNFHIKKNDIFVSAAIQKNDECEVLALFKSKLKSNIEKLNFIKMFEIDECFLPGQVGAGAMASFTNENKEEKILLATHDYNSLYKGEDILKPRAQNPKNFFGKILLIDIKKNEYEIYSMGHRNINGVYSNNDGSIILASENGPYGGDEINKINYGNNYGWNVSSYGEKNKEDRPSFPTIHKSHDKKNFTEPVFSFTPSISPTTILRLDNFSDFWEDNFLMGSLVYKHLLRLKFDKDYKRLILIEPIYIGERIRDLIYLKNHKTIIMALETSGSLAILKN